MFDLFRSRDKAVRWMLTALLVLVAASMLIYLIPGSGGPIYDAESIVAEIGDEILTAREVRMSLQTLMRERQIQSEMLAIFVPQFVNQMISERALAYQARRMGFEVTEADLAFAIQSIIPTLVQNGKFVGKDVYASFVQRQNLTIPEFENNVRKQLLLTRLQNVVLEGIVVTPDEVEREFRRANEKVKLDYISLNADKFKAQANVTPAEIQAQFNNNRASYQIPEKRSLAIVVIDEPRIAATTTMSDAELQRMYADNRERFRSPERVHVRHILLKTMDKPKEEIPKIQARAEDILKQIKAGADFGELARKHSEDPGSAVKGGDLDWVTRGQMVKPFEETSFSLKPKEISNVIKTDYGFHIVQVLQKEEANLKPFEAVKDQLLSERKRQYVFDRMQLISDQVRAALAKEPQQIDQIAQQHGVPVVRADKVGPGDPLPEIGLSTELDSALAPLNKGQVTPVVQVGPNKLAIAVVTDKIAARPADLNEVEGQIRQSLVERKASELMQKKATEAAGQAKSSGDLKAVAKSLGLEVKTTQPFEQTGAAEGIGPATLVSEAFSKPAGTVIGPIPTGSQTVITRVVEKLPADMAKLSESRGALVEQLKRRKASERKDLFEDGVLSTLTKQGKVKIHEDAIKQLIASYRS